MRICHYVASTGLGRGEAYVDLVNELCKHVEIVLLVPKGALFLPRLNKKIKVVEYRAKDSRRNPLLLLEIYRHLKAIKPDIVHTHFAKATGIFYRLNKFLKFPHVATKHNPRKGKIFNRLGNIIAVSDAVRNSIDNKNVTVIYNGIHKEQVKQVSPNKVFTIRAVGRLDKIKGFDLLISEVAKIDFDFRLEIIGEGDERANLEALIQELGLEGQVSLLGFRTDIPDLLASADLQVMSSLSEGFSLAMIEAIFYSKVFVSTKVGGCNEVLTSNLLVEDKEIAEKITSVYGDYAFYEDELKKIRENFLERLEVEKTAEIHVEYYHQLLSGYSRG